MADFEYHDNYVSFLSGGGMRGRFTDGSFYVNAYSISPGEDPDHKNTVGMTKYLTSYAFNFTVGRHATGTVANFWNQNINSDQNTFNHSAGALNFAFLGTLKLKFVPIDPTSPPVDATFQDVGLAQGHSGSTNNWWFGGKNCTCTTQWGADSVECKGKDSSDKDVTMVFQRGGPNPVDTVTLLAMFYTV